MVATLKMKKAQDRGTAGRPYDEKIRQVIADLAALQGAGDEVHPLLARRPVKNIGLVHITPDRGLSGGLHANINRKTGAFITEQEVPVHLVTVGRKGIDFFRRSRQQVTAEFSALGDAPSFLDTLPISRIIIEEFMNGSIDAVYVAYTRFITTMAQKPEIMQVLPVQPADIPRSQNVDYIYEPGHQAVLGGLLPRFVEMQIYHAVLEAIASEQSARMVAMRSATESANELIQELTLMYNKARQETITTELLDIVGGAAALS